MGAGRLLTVAALAGVAGGILLADAGLPGGKLAAPMAVVAVIALLTALGADRGRIGGGALLVGVACAACATGAWRADGTALASGPDSVLALVDRTQHRLVGTVVDDPRPKADRLQLVLDELTVVDDGLAREVRGRLLVWLPRGIDAGSGDRLAIEATLEAPRDFDGFAYREYLARQGIGAIARAFAAESAQGRVGPRAAIAGIRGSLLDGLNSLVPEPEAALGAGILLGVRSSIAPEVNDAFADAGLTHVVAISVWNIAIVTALIMALIRPLERRPGGRWMTAGLAVVSVGGYVLLTGASPSVVRAGLMAGAMLVARLSGSRSHATSALVLAALVMLLAAPPVLWDVGFQLSLLATAGLIWFGAAIEARLGRWPGWLREPVALTMAAQLTTLPIILLNFERLSLVAPLANVFVVPIVPLAMLASAIAALVGAAWATLPLGLAGDALAWLAGGAAWLTLRAMIAVGLAAASVPLAAVDVSLPTPLVAAWYPILALAAWSRTGGRDAGEPGEDVPLRVAHHGLGGHEGPRPPTWLHRVLHPRWALAGLVAILGVLTLGSLPDGRLHVFVLDIGQGDAVLVRTPTGGTMLVDGGPDPELTLRRLGETLPFHDRDIDVLLLSHPHQDHVAGLIDALARFRVRLVVHAGIPYANLAYDRLLADARREPGASVAFARAGQVLALDPATSVEIIYPSEADAASPLPDGDINNGSVVAVVRHGRFAALLTGDAEEPVERLLVGRGRVPRVDLLKVGHHGSTSSTTGPLLDAARPGVAVISAGVDNEHGHPAPEVIAALQARPGVAIFRTDLHGTVEVISDGLRYAVRTRAGTSSWRPVGATGTSSADAGSIGPWPSPTSSARASCSPSSSCPPASWFTPRASGAWPARLLAWWRGPVSRSRSTSWERLRCCTTSTSRRSATTVASTAWSARGHSRSSATRSSPCRSPPIRSAPCSTTIASRSAGRRCLSPWPIATWRRSS